MVVSRNSERKSRILCAICEKKCTGNVLRYQDQYYHKQCFESDNRPETVYSSQSSSSNNTTATNTIITAGGTTSSPLIEQQYLQQQQQQQQHQARQHAASLQTRKQQTINNQHTSPYHVQQDSNNNVNNNLNNFQYNNNHHQSNRQQMSTSKSLQQIIPSSTNLNQTTCAGCKQKINDGQALVALDLHWHIWCFKCSQCQTPLHGEYVAKDGKAFCEKDYQKLFGVVCVYCKRYITGKVLQAGEAHHFHPSCARCSKCGDPFVPGEEMYLQGEVTWHPRCGPGPTNSSTGGHLIQDEHILNDSSSRSQLRTSRGQSPSLSSRSRSASPFSYISRQYGRSSPGYADSEAVGDLSRIYTISYLNADPTQGYLRRPVEPNPPKSPQFSRPTSAIMQRDNRSRSSSRSQHNYPSSGIYSARDRSVPRGMYSVLSSMRSGSSVRARSPCMMNEEPIQLAAYPSGKKPSPDAVPKIERDDFPAPPFPYSKAGSTTTGRSSKNKALEGGYRGKSENGYGEKEEEEEEEDKEATSESRAMLNGEKKSLQQRASRPRSREIVIDDDESSADDPQLRKEEEELSKIASGIGKIFLQTLKEREKLRAWKRANLDPRNASRTPSAQRELPSRMRYENPLNASPSRDLDRPRVWNNDEQISDANLLEPTSEHSPTRTKSSLGRPSQMSSSTYGYKVVQSNRSTPRPGYGLSTNGLNNYDHQQLPHYSSTLPPSGHLMTSSQSMSFAQQQKNTQNRSNDLLQQSRTLPVQQSDLGNNVKQAINMVKPNFSSSSPSSFYGSPHLRRSMPNVNNLQHLHQEGPPKLYPYHLLATSNYRLPPGVDRCHLERHLSNEEFQYIFHCDRLDFYRLPEWKRNELKRRARLF